MKLAYLSDMFQKLSELNLQMQGNNTDFPQLADEIILFTRKLEMGEQCMKEIYRLIWEAEIIYWGQQAAEHCPMYEISLLYKEIFKVFTSAGSAKIRLDLTPSDDFSTAEERQFSLGHTPFCHILTEQDRFFCSCLNQDKYRSKLDSENELWVAVSKLQPSFENIRKTEQTHASYWKEKIYFAMRVP